MGVALGAFIVQQVTPREARAGTPGYPPIADRLDVLIGQVRAAANNDFWIFAGSLLLAALRVLNRVVDIPPQQLDAMCRRLDDRRAHDFDYSSDLEQLLSIPHRRAMIDIPIGLPDTGYRNCDVQARAWLGPSVFPGARRGLWAFASPAAANKHYWDCEGEGMGISCQLWNIGKKIKEVDDIVTFRRQRVLCETHPELIFWTRNGRKPLDKKKSAIGCKQRVAILKKMGFKNIEDMLERRWGTGIGRDDLIDACACAIAARDAKQTIGGAARDARGLLMQMHY